MMVDNTYIQSYSCLVVAFVIVVGCFVPTNAHSLLFMDMWFVQIYLNLIYTRDYKAFSLQSLVEIFSWPYNFDQTCGNLEAWPWGRCVDVVLSTIIQGVHLSREIIFFNP